MAKKIDIEFPTELHEITLKDVLYITEAKTPLSQGKRFLKRWSKLSDKKIKMLNNDQIIAMWAMVSDLLSHRKPRKPKQKIGEYSLPMDLLHIKVGHLLHLSGLELDNFNGTEIILGCFYRKDHDADYSDSELIETATAMQEESMEVALQGVELFKKFTKECRYRYPILFPEVRKPQNKDEKQEEDARRAYDMMMNLSQDVFANWKTVKNDTVNDAFIFMERQEKRKQLETKARAMGQAKTPRRRR